MDVLLATGRFPERSETFIYRKAVALATRGHHVTVITRQIGDWSLYPDPLPKTLRVELLPPDVDLLDRRRATAAVMAALRSTARAPIAVHRLFTLCQQRSSSRDEVFRQFLRHLPLLGRSTDVTHFEFLSMAAMYPLAREVLQSPVIASCRGSDVHTLELLPDRDREAALRAISNADALHCVSKAMVREVARVSGRTDGVWLNRPAVEIERIAVRSPSTSNAPLRLLATGRLVWKKGFDYLLAALAQLDRRGIDFSAEILGDGPLKSYMRFSIEDLGLEHRVRLVGAVSSAQVLSHMQAADVFVLSSVAEGISNAVLEAMASGLPIVTTNAGGMAEAVTDGVEGFVVPVRNVAALSDRIARLAVDRDLTIAMGRAARIRAETEFSIARQVDKFEEMYRTVSEVRR